MLYILLALVFIAGVILIFPVQIPKEESVPEHQQPFKNLSDSYPEHPKTIKDCENTSKRDFCIDDVAEITNNISLCYEINDPDVRVFCTARISLNEAMCEEVMDEGLRKACLESIGLKRSWSSPGYEESPSPDCMIEYGAGECVGGHLRIPFYNPNQQDITRMRITVPSGVRTNITLPADFTVNEPLHPGDTGVLTLFPCEEDVNTGGFSMEWCCSEKCYTSKMNQTSEEIEG